MRKYKGLLILFAGCLSLMTMAVAAEEIFVGTGQQRLLSIPGQRTGDIHVTGPLRVSEAGSGELRVVGMQEGAGSITVPTSMGTYEYSVRVISGDPANTISQMQALLGDLEPQLRFRVVGGRVIVEGEVKYTPALATFKRVMEMFPDAVSMVEITAPEQLVDVAVTLVEVEASSDNNFNLLNITPTGTFEFSVPLVSESLKTNIVAGLSLTTELMKALGALVASGKGRIIAQPRVVTIDRKPATISTGGQIPYRVLSDQGTQGLQYADYGLELTVTPELRSREVVLDLKLTSTDPVKKQGEPEYSFSSRKVEMNVAVQRGKSLVFARLYNRVSSGGTKVGCLFPLFAASSAVTQRELLVVVTPNAAGEGGIGYGDFELIKPADTGKQ
jgi:type IV pilus assembly protein PilQ